MKKNKILNWVISILSLLLIGLVTGLGVYFGTNQVNSSKPDNKSDQTNTVKTINIDDYSFYEDNGNFTGSPSEFSKNNYQLKLNVFEDNVKTNEIYSPICEKEIDHVVQSVNILKAIKSTKTYKYCDFSIDNPNFLIYTPYPYQAEVMIDTFKYQESMKVLDQEELRLRLWPVGKLNQGDLTELNSSNYQKNFNKIIEVDVNLYN